METSFEYALRVQREAEFKTLYDWYIDEVNSDGTVVENPTSKYVPWNGQIVFACKELDIATTHTLSRHARTKLREVEAHEQITGKLRPVSSAYKDRAPAYSMFGTSRLVKEFSFLIFPVKLEKEGFELFGTPEYAVEIDFRNVIEPDAIELHIYLEQKKFEDIANLLKGNSLSSMAIRMQKVSGLYDSWSPSIDTRHLKILTPDHELDRPDDVDVPCLGNVERLEVSTTTHNLLINRSSENATPADDRREDEPKLKSSIEDDRVVFELRALHKTLAQQTKFRWVFLLLMLLLIFSVT